MSGVVYLRGGRVRGVVYLRGESEGCSISEGGERVRGVVYLRGVRVRGVVYLKGGE